MSKWHYLNEEEIIYRGNKDDIRSGIYFCYDADTFDYLINNNSWVSANKAFEEQEYVGMHLDKMLESYDGEYIFIPSSSVATRIDDFYLLNDSEFEDKYKL